MRSKKSGSLSVEDSELSPSVDNSRQNEDHASRLTRLKLAIDEGTYKVSAQDVAEKMIRHLRDRSAKT